MNLLKKYKIFLFLIGLVLCPLILYAVSFLYPISPSVEQSFSERVSVWKGKIIKEGGVAAYAELITSMKRASPPDQHREAHIFGDALYEVEGPNGLSTCSLDFGYGCAHQLMARAIEVSGFSILEKLNQTCLTITSKSGCQHGIGHGLVAYLGYTENSLSTSISECEKLPDNQYIDGCVSGAFMEYNLRSMVGNGDSSNVRHAKSDEEWVSQCSTVKGFVKESCVFYLPQWWWMLLKNVYEPPTFRRMGELCDSFIDSQLVRICYEGIGQSVLGTAFDPKAAIAMCNASSANTSKRLFCRTYAANVFLGTGSPDKALEMCSGTEGDLLVYCRAYATGEGNLLRQLPYPQHFE